MSYRSKVDVAIVGAGAAGCLFAAKLAKADKSVVVLESGPPWELQDLLSSQIWARRLKWGGSPVLSGGSATFGYNMNAGWGFGGAALHHFGLWPRLHEDDFKLKSLFGRALDWPIDYQDLRPYYDRIQREVGISGDAEAEIWRPPGDPYPMRPLPTMPQGRVIARGFAKLGLRTAPIPAAVNSEPYQGRPACLYDGWCDAGCPINALAHPLAIYKPQADTFGAEFRSRSTALQVIADDKHSRVRGIRYIDPNGEQRFQEADAVVLAANAVQNARLLLNSATTRFPTGLANSSNLVGKYFMAHFALSIFGLFEEPTFPHLGINGGNLISQDGYDKDKRSKGFGSYQWVIGAALKPNDLLGIANARTELMGAELHTFMQRATRHIGTMGTTAEVLPELSNRIELADRKDSSGMPIARLVYNHSDNTKALMGHCENEGREIFKAAGAQEHWHGGTASVHMMGGTIMGDDRETSVTDSFGRTHDLPNLLVAGSSLFPSSGGVNPTFTIHALSQRTVDYMLENWTDFAA